MQCFVKTLEASIYLCKTLHLICLLSVNLSNQSSFPMFTDQEIPGNFTIFCYAWHAFCEVNNFDRNNHVNLCVRKDHLQLNWQFKWIFHQGFLQYDFFKWRSPMKEKQMIKRNPPLSHGTGFSQDTLLGFVNLVPFTNASNK